MKYRTSIVVTRALVSVFSLYSTDIKALLVTSPAWPREWKLSAINPHDRDTWRSGVRSAMCAASQLPGRGHTVVDIAPVPPR